MVISKNTSCLAGANGLAMQNRWIDLIEPQPTEPQDNRPCVDIARDIFKRMKGN